MGCVGGLQKSYWQKDQFAHIYPHCYMRSDGVWGKLIPVRVLEFLNHKVQVVPANKAEVLEH